jgi:hypothetical protein
MLRFILVSSLCLSSLACSHLSRPDNELRSEYLAITEPGISLDAAVKLIKNRIQPEGELLVRSNTPCLEREAPSQQKGSSSIKVDLGWYYWGATRTNTYGEWCFNDADQLIDIIVYKSFEAPMQTSP